MSNDIPLCETRSLCRRFSDGTRTLCILEDVNLSIRAGETVAILGTSGTGKSTFLHCLGLLDRPTSGAIFFCGRDVANAGEAEANRLRSREIGFIFQHYHLLPDFNVLENVALPARIARVSGGTARATELLAAVGLADRMHHMPRTLSGGERQRAAIARALCNRPGLLLCDEPTGNLDPATAGGVLDLLFESVRREGAAAVIVTHDAQVAKRAGRIYRLDAGRIVPA